MFRKTLIAVATASASLGGIVPLTTLAQDSDAGRMEEVMVTGSRIKRTDLEGVGPVTVVTSQTIEQSGITSVETLLQRLPASAGYGGNQSNAYWASNGYGTAQVNLRGLGANRTLVLLNGRRIVNGGTGANSSVDLNMIPVSLIERVEVLKDGASALYGADAVAGVVNIITRNEFDGLETRVRYGATDRGDGEDLTADITAGVVGERGNLMAAISYQNTDAVNMADREACPKYEVDGGLACSGSSSTIGGRAALPDGSRINFNQVPGGDGDFYEPYDGARHGFNYFPYLNAVNPIERLSLSTFGQLQLTNSTTAYTEIMYTNRQSEQLATPGSLVDIPFAADHPINPTGQDILLQRKRLLEAGPREFFQESDTYRIVLGARSDFDNGWSSDFALNWGRNTGTDGSTNIVNLERLDRALDPAQCGSNGVPCADVLGYGDISREALDYLLFTMRDRGGNEQFSATADVTGDLMQLPAGVVGFAAGLSYREEEGWRDPDALVVTGAANTNQQDPIDGSYTAREAYAEVSVPVLTDQLLARGLTLDFAGRYSDYDLFGDDFNYKVGVNWQVTEDVKIRGGFSTAFRVPNVPELFGGVAEGNLTTTDPCGGYGALPAGSNVYRNCRADGLPLDYEQFGNTILTTVGGNKELEPEQAETFTAGVVWQPSFLDGFSLTLDYFDIEITDAINSIDGSTKLAICYQSANKSHPFCDPRHFTRNGTTGEVNFLSAQPSNAAVEEVSGADLGVRYGTAAWGLDHELRVNVTYLGQYDVTPFEGAIPIEYAGLLTGGRGSYTKWRGDFAWSLGGQRWSGVYNIQWIGAADDINGTGAEIGSEVDDVLYHNVQFSYQISEQINLALGVDNLLDEDAPYVLSWTDANTDTMTYDLQGRRGYMRLVYRFQ